MDWTSSNDFLGRPRLAGQGGPLGGGIGRFRGVGEALLGSGVIVDSKGVTLWDQSALVGEKKADRPTSAACRTDPARGVQHDAKVIGVDQETIWRHSKLKWKRTGPSAESWVPPDSMESVIGCWAIGSPLARWAR